MKMLLAAASIGVSACAFSPAPGEPPAHKVTVDGETYLLSQITASTWTAIPSRATKPPAVNQSARTVLLQAIETASGCKVTDSDYSRQGRQLDAQVDCGSGLKNPFR